MASPCAPIGLADSINPRLAALPMVLPYVPTTRHATWTDADASPHVAQRACGGGDGTDNGPLAPSEVVERVLRVDDGALRAPYRRRRGEAKSVVHWGQRKLLMSEIEFLTLYCCPGAVVVYAGAAPGVHAPLLLDMFPDIAELHLVDPNAFAVRARGRLHIRQCMFTDALADAFADVRAAGAPLLFISDVRTGDWRSQSAEDVERHVWADMADQRRWHERMRPRASLLKFRLPYQPMRVRYLDGVVLAPVYGPKTTSETRLVPTGGTRLWDTAAYSDALFFFNTRTRVALYAHGVRAGDALDHCFDCASEAFILRRYLVTYRDVWATLLETSASGGEGGGGGGGDGGCGGSGSDSGDGERGSHDTTGDASSTAGSGGGTCATHAAAPHQPAGSLAADQLASAMPCATSAGLSDAQLDAATAAMVDLISSRLSRSGRSLGDSDLHDATRCYRNKVADLKRARPPSPSWDAWAEDEAGSSGRAVRARSHGIEQAAEADEVVAPVAPRPCDECGDGTA